MSEARRETIVAPDGTRLAVHRFGAGRPVVLLHGLFSSADTNWVKFGTAQWIADAGFEAIMPDLRAHGESAAPRDPAAYPPDVLAEDVLALVSALGLEDYDLGGFSLGARTSVRAVLRGLTPRRLILGGMGLEGLTGWLRRSAFFIDAIDRFDTIGRDDPAYMARQFMKSQNIDLVAARLLLGAVEDTEPVDLARVAMPTLVVCGADDRDNGNAEALTAALPDAHYVEVPGTHMSSVTQRQFGEAIAAFLAGA